MSRFIRLTNMVINTSKLVKIEKYDNKYKVVIKIKYNKYNNNYELTTSALRRPVSQVNFIRFLEFFIDIKRWNGNPNILDDSGGWGYGLQGNATPPKFFSINSPFGIARIDLNIVNISDLNVKFSDKKITFNASGEHIIQGL